jgi:hypothetical protein
VLRVFSGLGKIGVSGLQSRILVAVSELALQRAIARLIVLIVFHCTFTTVLVSAIEHGRFLLALQLGSVTMSAYPKSFVCGRAWHCIYVTGIQELAMKRFFITVFLLSTLTAWVQAFGVSAQETKPSKRAVHHKAHRAGHHGKTRHRRQTGA